MKQRLISMRRMCIPLLTLVLLSSCKPSDGDVEQHVRSTWQDIFAKNKIDGVGVSAFNPGTVLAQRIALHPFKADIADFKIIARQDATDKESDLTVTYTLNIDGGSDDMFVEDPKVFSPSGCSLTSKNLLKGDSFTCKRSISVVDLDNGWQITGY